ncbi:sensor domain-containing phosphodiesterase [Burkholderia alba]|uniref:sensor domain-containing phosphodiesterase n=1 Tax=Burkholderia alba TaxID=2683677 RepID=UPI002B051B80|nr:EAL domain-containing protein [Burkholderia alba]
MSSPRHLSLDSLMPQLARGPDGWCARYRDATLSSVFQPVLSITHKRVVGYEALVRAADAGSRPVSPGELFARAHAHGEALLLDRLTRCMHTANFAAQHIEVGWLFLNILPLVLDSGTAQREFIEALCAHFNLPPTRIVLEVVEQPSRDEAELARTIDLIQHRDFLVAIDDFGTGFSNFDRIWQMKPDIVKLDRSIVERALKPDDSHRIIHHLVTMLHQSGTMVLAEGVESDDALQVLMEADIDFVQGFLFGRPDASIARGCAAAPARLDAAWQRFAARRLECADSVQPGFDTIEQLVLAAAADYARHRDLPGAARHLLATPGARRVFVADASGEQHEPSVTSAAIAADAATGRLAPLFPETHSNWSRRPYFQRALATPGRVALMGPHFSLTDGRDCYTAAVALRIAGDIVVFCADFALDSAGTVMR